MQLTSTQKKIGLGVLAAIILYFVTKPPTTDSSTGGADPTGNGGTTQPGTNIFDAKAIADGLFDAMDGAGTDEAEIQNLLRTVSQSQFALVFKAFGKRDKGIFSTDLKDLKYWLKDELNSSEYNALRLKYPNNL